jgi:serine/threonine protein kinase
MARVYLAERKTGKGCRSMVALKVGTTMHHASSGDRSTRQVYLDALHNEVETLKCVHHPGIVRIYPVTRSESRGRQDPYVARALCLPGSPWFCALEYLAGGSLEELLQRERVLPTELAVTIAFQVGLALEHLHAAGIAHLDLKPDNVLFRDVPRAGVQPEPVLIDFGLSRRGNRSDSGAGAPVDAALDPIGPAGRRNEDQDRRGPFGWQDRPLYRYFRDENAKEGSRGPLGWRYVPPEHVRMTRGEDAPGAANDERPADIYGLGLLLYRMSTGRLPFRGHTRASIIRAVLYGRPIKPSWHNSTVPPALERIILRALAKDPGRRPRISEMLDMLHEAEPLRGHGSGNPTRPRLHGSPALWRRRETLLCALREWLDRGVLWYARRRGMRRTRDVTRRSWKSQ